MTKWLRALLKTWVDEGCMGALNDFHGCPGALYLEILQSLLFLLTHGYIYSTKLHEHNHTGTLYAYHLHVIPCTYICTMSCTCQNKPGVIMTWISQCDIAYLHGHE